MRKLTALVFAVALVFGMASLANAQQTVTWNVVTSPTISNLWPNEANSINRFEADIGLLGRVIQETDPNLLNACELAPSYPCTGSTPPNFLLPTGSAEGPAGVGGGSECNRLANACNTAVPPAAGHGGHLSEDGSYSYLVLHTTAIGTNPAGKGISFFQGSFVIENQPFICNDCPVGGFGKDINDQFAMDNTGPGSATAPLSVTLWITQSSSPFGHALISLEPAGAGAGKASACGVGIQYQTLSTDLCVDALSPGGNFLIPDQKVVAHTYSVNMAQHAGFGGTEGLCNPPDCYIEQVIIPAALAADANATAVMIQTASSVLPPDAPGSLANGTVDSLLFYYTTQLLDLDGDGIEDRIDGCPNDATNTCLLIPVPLGGGSCPAGTVFCSNSAGLAGCINAQLCSTRRDVNQDCSVGTADVAAPTGVFASQFFNLPFVVGPFDP